MTPARPWRLFKRLLLLFWAVWLAVVVAGNVADGLKALGVLAESFPFASGNYRLIREVTSPFVSAPAFASVLFAGAILWETLSMALFWWSGLTFQGAKDAASQRRLAITFTVGLGLWAAFQIACELFPSELSYRIAGTHRVLFTAQLATLLAVALLPEEA